MPVTDELGYLVHEFIEDRSVKFAEKMLMDLADEVAKANEPNHPDHREARKKVVETVMERSRQYAASIPTSSITWLSDMADRIVAIKAQQEAGVLPGIRIGIPQLDPYVHVVRDTELVCFCGYSSKGKTTMLVRAAASAYGEGEDVLMVSLEMESDEVWEIFDSHAARLSRAALRRRELGDDDYGRYEQAAARVKEAPNRLGLKKAESGVLTVDRLAAYVEQYRPKVLAVDYLSLMSPGTSNLKGYEGIALISGGLKRLAAAYGIKIYVAAQNNREAASDGPTEDNIALGNAIFFDCNVMVGVHQDAEMERLKKVQVRLIKNRSGPKGPPGKLHARGYGLFDEKWDRDTMEFDDWTPAMAYAIKMGLS